MAEIQDTTPRRDYMRHPQFTYNLPIHTTTRFLFLLIAGTTALRAQAPVDYDDVLLIVNEASDDSKEIAAYFAAARSIPERHIIRITTPTVETIDDVQFTAMRTAIESAIVARNLTDSINYLVTTKGLPFRVDRPSCDAGNDALSARRASIESELMLILGPIADSVGSCGWFFHTYGYLNQNRHFRRQDHGFYLVTRLDAYTVEGVKSLIDRGGPNRLVDKDSVLFVFDQEPGARDAAFHQSQELAAQIVQDRGWKALLNTDSVYVTDQRNVIGYASWGSNDRYHAPFAQNAIPRNSWSIGSLAETFVSTSGRSFAPGTGYGQSLIADWLAEGAVGAKGYVFEPFTIALAFPHVVFDRYTDETQDTAYNLAESFAMASRTLSWMEVVIGDPKTSIISEIPGAPAPTLPDTLRICRGRTTTVTPENDGRGIHHWFIGTEQQVVAVGPPYDERHPLWIASGNQLRSSDALESGDYVYMTSTIGGIGWAETHVEVLFVPDPVIKLPADTVEPNEPIQLTDLSSDVGTRVWNFGDGQTGEGAITTHTWNREGNFVIRLTLDNGGCSRTVLKNIVVRSSSGVGIDLAARGISVAPLPATDEIVVHFGRQIPGEVVLRVYDPVGRLIREQPAPSGARRVSIDMARDDLPAGIYALEVVVGTNRLRALIPFHPGR
jgi:uncharacterized protein (TIGR03790 family)